MSAIEETPCDVEELYGSLAGRLEQIVRLDVRAPEVVIEDACQVAWCRLLCHSHRVHQETVMAWLARTAVHEAFKLLRRDRRELSLEVALEDGLDPPCPAGASLPHEIVVQRERLAGLSSLPERQQRVVWLHALGFTYVDMAAHEHCTCRTVERQLLRARRALRDDRRAESLAAPD